MGTLNTSTKNGKKTHFHINVNTQTNAASKTDVILKKMNGKTFDMIFFYFFRV